jgi:hypothetical protein
VGDISGYLFGPLFPGFLLRFLLLVVGDCHQWVPIVGPLFSLCMSKISSGMNNFET